MHTYLLSDLHLTSERPAVTQAFLTFLAGPARNAERVYILGDLFEFWIGDDAASMLGADLILDAMAELAAAIECFFIAGNRDFLVRDAFSQRTGFTILNDETVVVGSRLAMELGTHVGDKLTVYSPQCFVSEDELRLPVELTVSGIFSVGMYDVDSKFMISSLPTARDVFALESGVQTIRLSGSAG